MVARDHIFAAGKAQKYYADENRSDRQFSKGEWVMLKAGGISAYERSDLPGKWRTRFLGLVEILEKIGDVSYRIELPPSMPRSLNIVHISRLKPCVQDEETKAVDIIIDAEGNIEQVVDSILAQRGTSKPRKFIVKFDAFPEDQAKLKTWSEMKNSKDLVKAY